MRRAEATVEEAEKPPTVCSDFQNGKGTVMLVKWVLTHYEERGGPPLNPLYLEGSKVSGHILDLK